MKLKFLLPLITLCAITLVFGTAYAAWTFNSDALINQSVQVEVPTWRFEDNDFAKIANINNCSYLTASQETSIVCNSSEAVRLTNTAGTQTKDHIFNVNLGSDYYLYDIATCKIEFDYYHASKREQNDKGFPKLQLYTGNTSRGTAQGGDDTVSSISPYTVTNLNADWWHLEYFVTSMCPTMANHQDKPQTNYTINRIRFIDKGVYDYGTTTAFMVIDNLRFTNEPGARLGLFNRTQGDTVGKYFWFKVAWSGDLHSCILSSSNPAIAAPEFPVDDVESTTSPFPNGSPFYFRLLSRGTVTLTATLEVGDNHTIQTISNSISVT